MGQRRDIQQTFLSIKELFETLFSLKGKGASDLNSMHQIDEALGAPHRQFRSIHVGGTNGKGSVCFKIAAALQAEGYKVGLYTSPHLVSFCERIRVNGQMISEEEVLKLLPPIMHCGQGTFFEYSTALAFTYFAEQQVDFAVIEVGIGGRLDATNVIDPVLSVITSVDYDHMHLLGNTLFEIAQEKAGIIKPNVPYVLGSRVPLQGGFRASFGSGAFYDEENKEIARLALQILGVSEEAIEEGIKVRPPCRFEIMHDRFVLDVAHNPDGMRKLTAAAQFHFPLRKFHFVVGLSEDKDVLTCLEILAQAGRVTCVEGSSDRLCKAKTLAAMIQSAQSASDMTTALSNSLPEEITIVCGSFYIMAEAKRSIENLGSASG
jgi:dihydrofolate synthase/folylpolyglutamate synthase